MKMSLSMTTCGGAVMRQGYLLWHLKVSEFSLQAVPG